MTPIPPVINNSIDQTEAMTDLVGSKTYLKAETNVGDATPQASIDSQELLQRDLLPKSIKGGVLALTTLLRTINIAEASITGIYQLGNFLDSDTFTGIALTVLSTFPINHANTPVYIDGVANGFMTYAGANIWNYVPGTPVIFSIWDHTLSAVFTGGTQHENTTTLTLEFATIATPAP